MKKYIKIIIFLIFNLFILTSCTEKTKLEKSNSEKEYINLEIGKIGNDIPIQRSLVSKMLALANYDKNEILSLENQIKFKDTEKSKWYNKYINAVFIKGDMKGVYEDAFMPDENLTLTQTQYLIDKYDKSKKIKIKINNENKDKPISYALWCEIYSKMMLDKNIKQENLTILETYKTNKKLNENYAITDKGIFCFEGIDIHKYLNTKVKVLLKNLDIIAITEVLEIEPILTRCYIKKIEKNSVNIFIGGLTKKLILSENINIPKENIGVFADIKIKNNFIINIDYILNEVNGDIKQVTPNYININNKNYILDDEFKVYSKFGNEINFKNLNNIYLGENSATFYSKSNENKLYCAILNQKPNFEKIRVLINNSDFSQNHFNNIEILNEGGFKIIINGIEKNTENKSIIINNNNDFSIAENEIIRLEPLNNQIGFEIKNLKRKDEVIYFGEIEIIKSNKGYILINEIEFEKYMEGVLASNNNNNTTNEMLKTLAVINRSIAINTILKNNFSHLGAHIDDKTLLYNNENSNEIIKNAIKQTYGEVITHNKEVIYPNYFAFSSGVTSNSGEIWEDKKFRQLPNENKPYLISKNLFENDNLENIKDEVNANIFFKSKDIKCMENDSPWFRWTTSLEKDEINLLNQNIKNIYKQTPYLIKVFENGIYINKDIENIGKIKDINILERGESGNVMKIEIEGDLAKILIFSDMAIKNTFKSKYLINNLGEKLENNFNLPSSNFVFDKVYDSNGYIEKITFYGGGYGHGVGLSLYAAKKLESENKNYAEIINYFYNDAEIINFFE